MQQHTAYEMETNMDTGTLDGLTVSDSTGPKAVIIPIGEYKRLAEDSDDYRLLLEVERRRVEGEGRILPGSVVWRGHHPVEDGYEPEFE
jgi:hypothetical protein